jgi:hypothetical protein
MMKRVSSAVLISAALLVLPPSPSQVESMPIGLFDVGATGLHCYQAPCPWRGIRLANGRGRPLWSGETLPAMNAKADDRQSIAGAWDKHDCVTVQGAFDGRTLTVRRVLGTCR